MTDFSNLMEALSCLAWKNQCPCYSVSIKARPLIPLVVSRWLYLISGPFRRWLSCLHPHVVFSKAERYLGREAAGGEKGPQLIDIK